MRLTSVRFVHPIMFRGSERQHVAPGGGNYQDCSATVEGQTVRLTDERTGDEITVPMSNVRSYTLVPVGEERRGPGRPRKIQ